MDMKVLLYADDMVLISESESKLQTLLKILHDWGYKWPVKVNAQKSKVIHFRKQNTLQTKSHFTMHNETLNSPYIQISKGNS